MARKQAGKPLLKVVAHLRNHELVKGYTGSLSVTHPEALLNPESIPLPPVIEVQPIETPQKKVSLPLASLKALFVVKSFKGHSDYKETNFFETHPSIEGLWVRLKFYDNELTEGMVRNRLDFLIDLGFFLKPPDPQSNNEIMYVVKASLIEFQVIDVSSVF